MEKVSQVVQSIDPETNRSGVGCIYFSFAAFSRIKKPKSNIYFKLYCWVGCPFSYLSNIFNSDPFTPLARCAQTESAEILSRRATSSVMRASVLSSME
jgi:hypothetical protein